MEKKDKLKVLEEIDLNEQERKKYSSQNYKIRLIFFQDPDDPNIYSMVDSGKKITREELEKYAKYSGIIVVGSPNHDRT